MNQNIAKKIEKFFSNYKPIRYNKNELILRSDDEDIVYIYFLELGYIKMYTLADAGNEIIVNIFKPYSFFPVILAMNGIKNKYNFAAISNAVIRKAPKDAVLNFLNKNPDILFDLSARLGKGINGLLRSYELLIAQSAYNRILMNLLTMSKRFGNESNDSVTIKLSLTHQDIADSVGLSRETVSRELKKMVKNKIISRKNKYITIINIKKIEQDLYYI